MTEEAKCIIEVMEMLNKCRDTPCFKCKKLEFNGLPACEDEESFYRHVASMIKSLSAQLGQVTRERDAIEDDFVRLANSLHSEFITYACEYCVENFPGYLCSACEFKWRGVEVE